MGGPSQPLPFACPAVWRPWRAATWRVCFRVGVGGSLVVARGGVVPPWWQQPCSCFTESALTPSFGLGMGWDKLWPVSSDQDEPATWQPVSRRCRSHALEVGCHHGWLPATHRLDVSGMSGGRWPGTSLCLPRGGCVEKVGFVALGERVSGAKTGLWGVVGRDTSRTLG